MLIDIIKSIIESIIDELGGGGLKFLTLFFLGGGGQKGLYCEGWGELLPHWSKNYSSLPFPYQEKSPPVDSVSPTNKKQFSCYNPIKTSFLAVVIAPVPFLFYLHTLVHTGHTNCDFNQCSIFTKSCF